ncbi:4'-phosphopantetheinyl transferase family protein [Actinacidiphila acidipaludis]|uniref:4'-phosphopantetheinyl transferase superfamily protein n=1 Tax=Actinacidiphila acidipaludis TaxID=2873382 RepID=A0ABS7QDH1_9ACTN|nr:4'-phosphopantetheinyl transferase superfamily protein [Streptomyces acidipaludis]MBY8881214.1 4'-phosphopantetheinyl transferase superfamily protein [Streptomyces acidipaludis]
MIEHVLPAAVRCRAVRGHALDRAPLHPEEAAAVARAVAKRKGEFAAGRACARAALGALGLPPLPVPRDGDRGAPVWPRGVVGSITHCEGYRAAAVARSPEILTLGIDAEPHGPLPEGVLDVVHSTAAEREALAALTEESPGLHWGRLLFSAKETVYKAWYPFHRRMLGFNEAELTFTRDPDADDRGAYTARLLVPGPLLAEGVGPDVFSGRWLVRDGLLVTAIAVPGATGPLAGQAGAHLRGSRQAATEGRRAGAPADEQAGEAEGPSVRPTPAAPASS